MTTLACNDRTYPAFLVRFDLTDDEKAGILISAIQDKYPLNADVVELPHDAQAALTFLAINAPTPIVAKGIWLNIMQHLPLDTAPAIEFATQIWSHLYRKGGISLAHAIYTSAAFDNAPPQKQHTCIALFLREYTHSEFPVCRKQTSLISDTRFAGALLDALIIIAVTHKTTTPPSLCIYNEYSVETTQGHLFCTRALATYPRAEQPLLLATLRTNSATSVAVPLDALIESIATPASVRIEKAIGSPSTLLVNVNHTALIINVACTVLEDAPTALHVFTLGLVRACTREAHMDTLHAITTRVPVALIDQERYADSFVLAEHAFRVSGDADAVMRTIYYIWLDPEHKIPYLRSLRQRYAYRDRQCVDKLIQMHCPDGLGAASKRAAPTQDVADDDDDDDDDEEDEGSTSECTSSESEGSIITVHSDGESVDTHDDDDE
jgi:hypothetical protein